MTAVGAKSNNDDDEWKLYRPKLSHTSDLKLVLYWLPCQVPCVIGSALGLVGLVSVHCDCVRLQVLSAVPISV